MAVLLAAVVVTSILGTAMSLLFPLDLESDAATLHAEVESSRDSVRWILVLGAVNLVVGVSALALAGLLLVPARGADSATVGAVAMWLGAAFYGVGVGGWAEAFPTATHPALDASASRELVAELVADPARLFVTAGTGAGLVALGTVLLSVGLWRARTVPRWVPAVAAVSIVLTFVFPTAGPVGLLVEIPVAVSSIAIGWYSWQRISAGNHTAVLVAPSAH
jgi:hypothetical protein